MSSGTLFKECPNCHFMWKNRGLFLSDPDIAVIGYQVNFSALDAGFFLFMHNSLMCGTTLAVRAGDFVDLHDGPIFLTKKNGTPECEGHCLHTSDLDPCGEKCECAYVRDVLQKVRKWPKRKGGPNGNGR